MIRHSHHVVYMHTATCTQKAAKLLVQQPTLAITEDGLQSFQQGYEFLGYFMVCTRSCSSLIQAMKCAPRNSF